MLLKSPVLLESELAAIQLDSQLKTCTFQLSFQVGEGGGGEGGAGLPAQGTSQLSLLVRRGHAEDVIACIVI